MYIKEDFCNQIITDSSEQCAIPQAAYLTYIFHLMYGKLYIFPLPIRVKKCLFYFNIVSYRAFEQNGCLFAKVTAGQPF